MEWLILDIRISVCKYLKVTSKGMNLEGAIDIVSVPFLFALDQSDVKYISKVKSKISGAVSMGGAQVHLPLTLNRRLPMGNSHCIKNGIFHEGVCLVNVNNSSLRANLFTCTKDIFDGKLQFLCIASTAGFDPVCRYRNVIERVFVLAFICWLFQGTHFTLTID